MNDEELVALLSKWVRHLDKLSPTTDLEFTAILKSGETVVTVGNLCSECAIGILEDAQHDGEVMH